jgi:hypothetical protein
MRAAWDHARSWLAQQLLVEFQKSYQRVVRKYAKVAA